MPLSRVRRAVVPLALLGTLLAFAPTAVAAPADDPLAADQWGLAAVAAPDAWDAITADDVVIAVVDSGVALAHPDLTPVLLPGIDLVDGDDQPDDPNGHGTHVAGIAAATVGNGIGIAGVAAGARILPVRVLDADGNGDPATIAEGILWAADHGADVINLSLATAGIGDRLFKGGPINAAIRTTAAAGVTVIAAAGNDDEFARAYRARVPVLVVNATDPSGAPAEFTAFGDPRAVAAPGVDILSTAPTGPTTLWPDGTDGYARLDGTSMAAPHAAGVAALLAAAGVTGPAAIDQILATATPGDDPRLGAGLIDAAAAAVDLPATGPATPTPSATPDTADDTPTATAPETVTPTAGEDATTAAAPIRTVRRGRWLIGLAVLALITVGIVIAVRK